jgi:hypothetical protein
MSYLRQVNNHLRPRGEGVSGSGDLVIGSSGDRKSKIQTLTPIGIGMGQTYANLG